MRGLRLQGLHRFFSPWGAAACVSIDARRRRRRIWRGRVAVAEMVPGDVKCAPGIFLGRGRPADTTMRTY